MHHLENFIPITYNKLTKEEKFQSVINLADEILESLSIPKIPILVVDKGCDFSLCGNFVNYPPSIYINDFLVDSQKAKDAISDLIDHNTFLPYFLVCTLAHECYHYYQFCTINKLINNQLTSTEEKDIAYLYFISLYNKLFKDFCYKKNLSMEDNLSEDILYNYSVIERSADGFAEKILNLLSKKDINDANLEYFKKLNNIIENYKPKLENKSSEELSIDVIKENLIYAMAFLEYKNFNSGLKEKYLGIDEKELKESIERIIKDMEIDFNNKNNLSNKITKKQLKKNL